MANQELKLAEKAIETGTITRQQLEECLGIQKNLAKMGLPRTLAQILIEKKYITEELWKRIGYNLIYDNELPEIVDTPSDDAFKAITGAIPQMYKENEDVDEKDILGLNVTLHDNCSDQIKNGSSEESLDNPLEDSLESKVAVLDLTADEADIKMEALPNSESLLVVDEVTTEELQNIDSAKIEEESNESSGELIFSDELLPDSEDFKTAKETQELENIISSGESPEEIAVENFPKIPGYKIIKKLGGGAMGTVYQGIQVSMERAIAIKVLSDELSNDPSIVERFVRESRAVAKLNHENIISGIDAGTTKKGIYYFVMEFIKGRSLGEILDSERKIGEKRALEITLQIANALEYAREQSIIHRDIKPENMMITNTGIAKLCDLGLVRETSKQSSLTLVGHTIGTPQYISPEQAKGKQNVDTRADIYSLGASLYHMVTGSVPFPQKNPAVVCTLHATKPIPDPRKINPDLSQGVCSIIAKCTAKKRDQRYQTPLALAKDIKKVLSILEQRESPEKTVPLDFLADANSKQFAQEHVLEFADEVPKGLGVTQERKKFSQKRLKYHGRQTKAVPVQSANEKQENILLVVGLASVLIIVAGLGYIIYPWIAEMRAKRKIDNTKLNNLAREEKAKLEEAQKAIEKIKDTVKYLNTSKVEEVKKIFNRYKELSNKYTSQNILNDINDAKIKFENILKIRANKNLKRLGDFNEKTPLEIKDKYLQYVSFPPGLMYLQENKEKVFAQKERLFKKLENCCRKKIEQAESLKAQSEYLKAIKIYEQIQKYAIGKYTEEIKLAIEELELAYKTRQQKHMNKYGKKLIDAFYGEVVKEKYDRAKTVYENYMQYRGLHLKTESFRRRLKHLKKLVQSIKTGINTSKIKKWSREKLQEELFYKNIIKNSKIKAEADWVFAIICFKYFAFNKARQFFESVDDLDESEFIDKYYMVKIDRYIKEDNAKRSLSSLKKLEKKIVKTSQRSSIEIYDKIEDDYRRFSKTKSYKKYKNFVGKIRYKVWKNYALKNAFHLYFKKEFSEYPSVSNSYAFKIRYSFEKKNELKDFYFYKNKENPISLKVKDGLKVSFESKVGLFEMIWKGYLSQSSIVMNIRLIDESPANIGIFFYKKLKDFQKLDKFLCLTHFDLYKMLYVEMRHKAGKIDNKLEEKFKKGSKKANICFTQGNPRTLRYRKSQLSENITKFETRDSYKLVGEANIQKVVFRINREKKLYMKNKKEISRGYSGIYSNSPFIIDSIEIEGKLHPDFAKKIQKNIVKRFLSKFDK